MRSSVFILLVLCSCRTTQYSIISKDPVLPKNLTEKRVGKTYDTHYIPTRIRFVDESINRNKLDVLINHWRKTKVELIFNDIDYVLVDISWLEGYFNNLWMQSIQDMKYIPQAEDCDNYAYRYFARLTKLSRYTGLQAQIACGVMIVKKKYEFGGLRGPPTLHALNIVGTNKGLYVIEPQSTNACVHISQYPDRDNILYIFF